MVYQHKISTLASELNKNGFIVVDSYLGENVVRELQKTLDFEVNFGEDLRDYIGFDKCHIHDLFVRYPQFLDLLQDQFLDSLLAEFLGSFWVMYAATSSSVPPNGSNFASRIHVDSPRLVPNFPFNMGVIWTLSDYNFDNGSLEVLPGSHVFPDEPSIEYFNKNKVSIRCKMGSLIVFNARLFHRTSSNNSEFWRHAMTLNACRPFMKQRLDWVRFIGEDKVKKCQPLTRRILGFDTRVPSNMHEFVLPDAQRLYKPNQG